MDKISPKYSTASLFFVAILIALIIFCLQIYKKYLDYLDFTAEGEIILPIERSYIKSKNYALESVIRAHTKEFFGFRLAPSVEGAEEILKAEKERLNARKLRIAKLEQNKFSAVLEEKLKRFDDEIAGQKPQQSAAQQALEPTSAAQAASEKTPLSPALARRLARFDELAARTLLALSPKKLSIAQGFRVLKFRHKSATFYASVRLFAPAPPPARGALLAEKGAHTQILHSAAAAQKLAAKSPPKTLADAELIDEFADAKFARVRLKTRPSFLAYLRSHALLDADILAPAPSENGFFAAPAPATHSAPTAAPGLAQSVADWLHERIAAQHESIKMREFFAALYLAKPYGAELRRDVNFQGTAHLLAISGYHLGLIYSCLFWLLLHALKPLRHHALRHISTQLICALFAFGALGGYFALIGLVPSFFRAFCMAVFAFCAVLLGLRLRSLAVLFAALGICLLAEPALAFELGFFFSALGVFYIFLFAAHFAPQSVHIRGRFRAAEPTFLQRHRWSFLAFFEAFVFFSMVIPVLAFFPLLSLQQLLALVLTPLFVIFYPLSLALHLLGAGGLMDDFLLELLAFRLPSVDFFIPQPALLAYLALSAFALRFRALIWLILALNMGVFVLQFVH